MLSTSATTITGAKTAAVDPENAKNNNKTCTVGGHNNNKTEGLEDGKNSENKNNNAYLQLNAMLIIELKSAMQAEK